MFDLGIKLISVFLVVFFIGCVSSGTKDAAIDAAFRKGDYSKTAEIIKQEIHASGGDSLKIVKFRSRLELMDRLRLEFSLSKKDARLQLNKYYPVVTDSMMNVWEESGDLEMRIIDGKKCYFNRAVGNFFRVNKQAKALKDSVDGKRLDDVGRFQHRYLSALFSGGNIQKAVPFDERKMRVDYTVSLKANAVPEGEKVSCWLPFPRQNSLRLKNIELISVNDSAYIIAPEDYLQRSIYMEKTAVKDSTLDFCIAYQFQTAALWFDIQPEDAIEYDKNSDLYNKYTAECPPHIIFSDSVVSLAHRIVGDQTNPVEQVRRLYYWLNDTIPWAGALEYSVMDCIPAYVLENRRGDCGMQTFLFMSMARSLGIPCKWQSGWYLLPEEKNLHDWCEVYYNGVGWVPVDVSFKLVRSPDQRIREFYINGMDSYRLIINDDVAQAFFPEKKFPRSEPFDFQRGELEWKGGNLYFDKWTYRMKVLVLD